MKEKTTEVLPLANYEYDGEYPPKPIGLSSLLFGTTVGRWGVVTEVFFKGGVPQGEIVVSAHVPKLLDGKFRTIASGQATGKILCLTTNKPNMAYLYQSYNQGADRVQSAWNKWSFPAPRKILWATIMGSVAYFLFQWDGICTLEVVQLDAEGDEPNEKFPLRLDHRVSEAGAVYNEAGYFTLTLPYNVDDAKRSYFSCFEREDVAEFSQRGRQLGYTWVDARTIRVPTDSPSRKFFFGSIPVARRKDTRLFARDRADQPIIHDKLLIYRVSVSHKDTVEYDIVYHRRDGSKVSQTFTGRILGDATIMNQDVPVTTGSFTANVNSVAEDAVIELVNKTPFPAIWTAMKYTYELTVKAGR
ncbi:hypothetical protein HGG76_02525 [Ochrobactrum tritici]|uniref:Uncharacterized protein n=1 Tax=Brucella tritici TaxID=94626 RepID=A0A7X6FNM8_9HYPH|nr:hypothetical protein [Brucella tritici]